MKACFDAFALLSWFQREPGAVRVRDFLAEAEGSPENAVYMSVVNLGEVYYRVMRARGIERADELWNEVGGGGVPITLLGASQSRVRAAAAIKGRHLVSYADGFAIATAKELGVPLVTGDPEILAIRDALDITLVELPHR
ncbi:MAG: type II toxin-antitoxin system VapC family toxin [Acidobacteriota bacterium]